MHFTRRAARAWFATLALAGLGLAHVPSTAGAQARPRMLDESELYLRLWTPSPEGGYVVRLDATVYGITSDQDAIRLDVKQGTRTIATTRCRYSARDGDAGQLRNCETDSGAPLTATGDLRIDVVYLDDVAETSEVLRTLNVTVNAYPYWVRNDGSRQIMGARYQIDGSDQLGTAFVYQENASLTQTEAHEPQAIYFYTTFSGSFSGGGSPVFRCTVNGERIPDRRTSWSSFAEYDVEERVSPTADTRRVGWYRARIHVQDLWWGTRIPLPASGSGYNTAETQFLGDHPGLWSCDFRRDGQVLRTFRFTADAQGRIAPHAEETSASPLRLLSSVHLVDVRIPNPSPIDAAVDPAAIRRASQYGRAWSAPDAVREMLAALPPASGSVAPTRVGGGGGGGRGRRGR